MKWYPYGHDFGNAKIGGVTALRDGSTCSCSIPTAFARADITAMRNLGVKVVSFVYVGLASGFVGVLAILINNNFYPTVGDGYLLTVLAAIFVGGTPGIGGIGTVAGGIVGAFTVGFIESGIVAAGLTGYWTQFVYGIVIVLSLVTHRLYSPQHKK